MITARGQSHLEGEGRGTDVKSLAGVPHRWGESMSAITLSGQD